MQAFLFLDDISLVGCDAGKVAGLSTRPGHCQNFNFLSLPQAKMQPQPAAGIKAGGAANFAALFVAAETREFGIALDRP